MYDSPQSAPHELHKFLTRSGFIIALADERSLIVMILDPNDDRKKMLRKHLTQRHWETFDAYTHMADILRALKWRGRHQSNVFQIPMTLCLHGIVILSALSTILEDDNWQVRFRSKEDAKKAFGSKETADERRLKALLFEDERLLGFPIRWQIFEIYPEPTSAACLNPSLRLLDFGPRGTRMPEYDVRGPPP